MKELLSFAKESSELSCQNRSACNFQLAVDTQINHFISSVRKPFANDLMTDLEKGIDVDIFYLDKLDKKVSIEKTHFITLIDHDGNPLTDMHENDTVMADPIIDKITTKAEVDADLFESFDVSFVTLSSIVKNEVWNLV